MAKGNELEAYLQAFERVPGQQGVLVLIKAIAGFDRRRPDVVTCPGKSLTLSGVDRPSVPRRDGSALCVTTL